MLINEDCEKNKNESEKELCWTSCTLIGLP